MKKYLAFLAVVGMFLFLTEVAVTSAADKAPKTATLTGKVMDNTSQETLAGALVQIEGTDLKTYSDLEGNFEISGILPDTYKVKCSLISYNEQEKEVKIDQNSGNIDIRLENIVTE